MSEPTFTLAEARLELARRECGMHGHDFTIIQGMGGQPRQILCGNGCGAGPWPVGAPGGRNGG